MRHTSHAACLPDRATVPLEHGAHASPLGDAWPGPQSPHVVSAAAMQLALSCVPAAHAAHGLQVAWPFASWNVSPETHGVQLVCSVPAACVPTLQGSHSVLRPVPLPCRPGVHGMQNAELVAAALGE